MSILHNLDKYNIILCSNSPRRKELLKGLGISFRTRVIENIDESYDKNLSGIEIVEMITQKKAAAYKQTMNLNELIITADTIVYANGKVLGKPKDRHDAIRMLGLLSGKSHEVITGVCVQTFNKQILFSTSTKVEFMSLTDDEIEFYIDNYHPFDKAGAYGIQEWIGFIGVKSIQGSFYNVMGLPIQKLYTKLKEL